MLFQFVPSSRPATDGGPDAGRAAAARRRLLADHRETVAAVIDAADEVVAGRDEPIDESAAVTGPLSAGLERRGLAEPLLSALADAVEAVGAELLHEPAPAPPYLAVTSQGPVLRATVEAGRLVVVVGVFAVERGETVRYVRTGDTPGSVLRVELHGDDGRHVAGPAGADAAADGDGTDRPDRAGKDG